MYKQQQRNIHTILLIVLKFNFTFICSLIRNDLDISKHELAKNSIYKDS
jgi:hypothetical protein